MLHDEIICTNRSLMYIDKFAESAGLSIACVMTILIKENNASFTISRKIGSCCGKLI